MSGTLSLSGTLKLPDQEPKRDLSGTTVQIAEYDRVTLNMIHSWPVNEYALKTEATRAKLFVMGLVEAAFPDPGHKGTRPLTEQDMDALRVAVAEYMAAPAV